MIRRLNLVIIILVLVTKNESARILAVFPVPSISHQVVFRPLTQELAKRGHELTIWTPDPAFAPGKTPPNLTEIDLHDMSYKIWREKVVATIDGASDALEIMRILFQVGQDVFEMQYFTGEIQNVLKSKKFDLLMVEACIRPALVLSLRVKGVPVIQISSLGGLNFNYQALGAPIHPVLYPDSLVKKLNDLSLFDKIDILRYNYDVQNLVYEQNKHINQFIRNNFGTNAPTISELENNVDMLFLNIHPIWEANRPVPPGVIHMGGLHNMKPVKELPNDLMKYLDSSKHGVIYMSFGTNVDPALLPPEKLKIFLKVLSKLPYDVLLKWSSNELEGKPKNVKIFKWLPQSDLLRHPKIKLFITQAGLQSSDEAITAGVPLIAFPMLGDQWYNAENYVRLNIGLQLDIQTVTEEIFNEAINKVIDDPSFRKNIKKLGIIMRDQPQTSLERAVWWTEYVIRHKGAKHLRSPAANMHWTEYYMMDVVVVVLLGAAITCVSSIILVMFLVKFINHFFNSNKKQKSS